MNKTHTQILQFCKFFLLILALFFINSTLHASHADLELTMTSPNASPGIYENVDIEITITNNGPETTENVLLEFPFPSNLPITGDPVETQGFFSNWWTGTGTWTVGTLESGQTETVTLTLFTLTEDVVFFYGQVVNSSIVDDDSTPDNGTPPTPNEDDEAVIAINDTGGGNCDLSVFISNIVCDDNGTPNQPNDDLFSFDFSPANPAQPGGSWTASMPDANGGVQYFNGNYGETTTVTLPISLFPGGTLLFTVSDQNPTCSAPGLVAVPAPCSNANPCSISATTSNIQCFDNGTPDNANDDTWSFDLNVTGQNAGSSWMANINGQTYTGTYGSTTALGLFPISGGLLNVAIADTNNPACSTTLNVTQPPTCSNGGGQCSITANVVDIDCNDQGTTNPDDDTWSYTVQVDGTNVGTDEWVTSIPFGLPGAGGFIFGDYGETFSISNVPLTAGFQSVNHLIRHVPDLDCQTTITIDAPPSPCNNTGCSITANVVSVDCNDQGTANPDDDTWSYTVQVDGTNVGDDQWVTSIPFGLPGAGGFIFGDYGETFSISNVPLTAGFQSVNHLIRHVPDLDCQTTITIDAPPSPCNNTGCSITANVVSVDCNTQGTANPDDDTWSYIVDIDGTNASNNWVVELANSPNNVTFSGPYTSNFTLENIPLTGTQVEMQTVMDAANPNCFTTILVNPPFPCSNAVKPDLELTMTSTNQPGIYQNISYEVTVTNTGNAPANGVEIFGNTPDNVVLQGGNECDANTGFISCQLSSIGWILTTLAPGQSETLTVNFFTLDANPVTFYLQVTDMNGEDEDSTPGNGTPPTVNEDDEAAFTLGNGGNCNINGTLVSTQCQDNNTPNDPSDDVWAFVLNVSNLGSNGNSYLAQVNGNTFTVAYDEDVPFGNYPITNGDITVILTDQFAPSCSETIVIPAIAPCSNGGGGDTDLKLEVTSNTMFAGSSVVVYTATITNEGPNDASGVSMQFDNGSSFGITDFIVSTGSYSYATDIWSVGTIAAGTSETIILDDQYVDFNANSLPTYPFFEILTMDGNDPDSTPGNDNGDRTANEDDEAILEIFPDGMGGYPSDLALNLNTPSTTVNVGETFSVFYSINLESGAAAVDVEADIVLPSTVQYQGFNTATGTYNASTGIWDVGYIGGLTNAELEITVTLVDDSQPSVFYGQITDSGSFDFDSDPNNGTCCVANEDDEAALTVTTGGVLKPDLTSIAATATVSANNTSIAGEWTISNIGTAPSGGFVNRVYLSDDNQYSVDDYFFVSFPISGPFAVNQTEDLSFSNYALPAGLSPGTYYVIFYVDQVDAINESNESNNILAVPITITGNQNGADVELIVSSNSTFQQWDYVAFDITVSNTGSEPLTGLEILLENIAGGVLQGGNEGTASAGTFYPVGGAPSHWDLSGITIQPNDSETLTINCFVLDPNEISVYAQVIAMNEADVDSSPNNGTPFVNGEDDESTATVSNSSPLIQVHSGSTNNTQVANYQDFKIQNLYPNPVNAHLKIAVASASQSDAILQIANTQGSEVAYLKTALQQGQNVLAMDVSMLPKGIYFLKIETEGGMEVQRFLKE